MSIVLYKKQNDIIKYEPITSEHFTLSKTNLLDLPNELIGMIMIKIVNLSPFTRCNGWFYACGLVGSCKRTMSIFTNIVKYDNIFIINVTRPVPEIIYSDVENEKLLMKWCDYWKSILKLTPHVYHTYYNTLRIQNGVDGLVFS